MVDALAIAHSSNNENLLMQALPRDGDKDNDACFTCNISWALYRQLFSVLYSKSRSSIVIAFIDVLISLITIDNGAHLTLFYSEK